MVDERLDDDRLAAVLASVGEHLVIDAPGSAATVGSAGRTWRRPLLVAAAALIVVAGTVAAIAPARRAVSGWFGAGRIEVEIDRVADAHRIAVVRRSGRADRPGRGRRGARPGDAAGGRQRARLAE